MGRKDGDSTNEKVKKTTEAKRVPNSLGGKKKEATQRVKRKVTDRYRLE